MSLVEERKRCRERRRFAAAGWAGDQDQPVRRAQVFAEDVSVARIEPQPFEVERSADVVEEADRDSLAVRGRHRCDTQIEAALIDANARAAVLRDAPFGDVQSR